MTQTDRPRPLKALEEYGKRYPRAWKEFARFVEMKGKGLPTWPEWCYCPLAASYAIVSHGQRLPGVDPRAADIGPLGALAAWRQSKAIYRFDLDAIEAICETPLDRELPRELLYRLPHWCVYVELPSFGGSGNGFFAHLESDVNDGRTELRIVVDGDEPDGTQRLIGIPIHLTKPTLAQCLEASRAESAFQYAANATRTPEQMKDFEKTVISGASRADPYVTRYVALLLYLCSSNADIAQSEQPSNGSKGTKRNKKPSAAAQAPRYWDVAFRIGDALRAAGERKERSEAPEGTHASPRPHMRRAHWHTYWIGKKGEQEQILKWVAPTLVAAENHEDVVTTTHDMQ